MDANDDIMNVKRPIQSPRGGSYSSKWTCRSANRMFARGASILSPITPSKPVVGEQAALFLRNRAHILSMKRGLDWDGEVAHEITGRRAKQRFGSLGRSTIDCIAGRLDWALDQRGVAS